MSSRVEAAYRAIANDVTAGITYMVGHNVSDDVEYVVRPIIEAAVKAGIVDWAQ